MLGALHALRGRLRALTGAGLCLLVRAYQVALAPQLGGQCRFTPSCSNYALEAIARHGPLAGLALTLRRLARCQPFCAGGLDPVPPARAPSAATPFAARPAAPGSPLARARPAARAPVADGARGGA